MELVGYVIKGSHESLNLASTTQRWPESEFQCSVGRLFLVIWSGSSELCAGLEGRKAAGRGGESESRIRAHVV